MLECFTQMLPATVPRLSLKSAYKHHEDAKKREYGHRIRDIEHRRSFHPTGFYLRHWRRWDVRPLWCTDV